MSIIFKITEFYTLANYVQKYIVNFYNIFRPQTDLSITSVPDMIHQTSFFITTVITVGLHKLMLIMKYAYLSLEYAEK